VIAATVIYPLAFFPHFDGKKNISSLFSAISSFAFFS
tara:strand:- start:518 stop:628 length:111 start_codon:yes stop_codon:yes gene_type:complete